MIAVFDEQAVSVEIERLRGVYAFADADELSTKWRNDRKLTWREFAEWNVEAQERADQNLADKVGAPGGGVGSQTDRELFAGIPTLREQFISLFGEKQGLKKLAKTVRKAIARGYRPSANDFWQGHLEDQEGGNPECFVSMAGGGRSQIRKAVERRGVASEGMVTVRASEYRPPVKHKPLAEGIIRRTIRAMVKEDPGLLQRRKLADVREEILAEQGDNTKD